MKKNVVVIGGGISGLSAAYRLETHASEALHCSIVEKAERVGGKIETVHENGFTIEAGPDSFIPRKPAVLELCHSLGLDDQVIPANKAGGVFVWHRGKLLAMPPGAIMLSPFPLMPFLRSSLISWPGKVRMGLDLFIPPRTENGDESLGSFVRRRLGQEALDKIAGPLLAGIFSADPDTLSLASTFPNFAAMEMKYGSLLRGMLAQRSAQRSAQPKPAAAAFLTLRGGMRQLVGALTRQMRSTSILQGHTVATVLKTASGQFEIILDNAQSLAADSIIFTTPSYITADLVQSFDPGLASELRAIRFVSTATVSLAFKRGDIPHPLNGSGFVVPKAEGRRINACTWSSVKFAGRAPEGFVLLRVFIGGALGSQFAEQSEAELIKLAIEELRVTMGITADPILTKAYRWPHAAAQYEVGHQTRIEEIEKRAATHQGLYLAGASYRGAGVPDCIQSGQGTADKILLDLSKKTQVTDQILYV